MFQPLIGITKLRMLGILVFAVITAGAPQNSFSFQTSLTLIPVPEEAIYPAFDWSSDSQSLIFDGVSKTPGQDKVHVIYNISTQISVETVLDQPLVEKLPLTTDELTRLNPVISTADNQPLVFLSPDKRYAVYPLNSWKYDDSGLGVQLFPVYLADLIMKQDVNTNIYIQDPRNSLSIQWNRSSSVFAVNTIAYEKGIRVLAGMVNSFNSNLTNLKVYQIQDEFVVSGQVYVPGGTLILDSILPNLTIYGISDKATPEIVLMGVSCGASIDAPRQPNCAPLVRLALYNFDNPNQSQVITQIDGDNTVAASFSANNEQVIWAVTDKGLIQFNTKTGSTTIIDAKLSNTWAGVAQFSPDRRWLALMNTESGHHIFIVKLPAVS